MADRFYTQAKDLADLCYRLNAIPPPAGFDFSTLPTFGGPPAWLKDGTLVASWSHDAVILLPGLPGRPFEVFHGSR